MSRKNGKPQPTVPNLPPRDADQVGGGQRTHLGDIVITKELDKTSARLN